MTQEHSGGYAKPLPKIDALTLPHWEHARQHRLSVQACCDCGDLHYPAGPVCPKCLSDQQEWRVVSGRGSLVSWCRFHKAYWDGYAQDLPYDVCVVRLEEGPLLVSNVALQHAEKLRMGMPVKAVFEDVTAEVSLHRFEPV